MTHQNANHHQGHLYNTAAHDNMSNLQRLPRRQNDVTGQPNLVTVRAQAAKPRQVHRSNVLPAAHVLSTTLANKKNPDRSLLTLSTVG